MNESPKVITIVSEYITLGQFLKHADIISNGGEAKSFIFDNLILVNGEEEKRRGKKLRTGDKIEINNLVFVIE